MTAFHFIQNIHSFCKMPFGSAFFGSCQQCIIERLPVQCVPVELIQNINVIEISHAGVGGGSGDDCFQLFSQNGFQNDLKHTAGVLSMARSMMPNSAGSQFFIMHKASPHLDGSYAAFGKVTEGMEQMKKSGHAAIFWLKVMGREFASFQGIVHIWGRDYPYRSGFELIILLKDIVGFTERRGTRRNWMAERSC